MPADRPVIVRRNAGNRLIMQTGRTRSCGQIYIIRYSRRFGFRLAGIRDLDSLEPFAARPVLSGGAVRLFLAWNLLRRPMRRDESRNALRARASRASDASPKRPNSAPNMISTALALQKGPKPQQRRFAHPSPHIGLVGPARTGQGAGGPHQALVWTARRLTPPRFRAAHPR
jgi:hypothetical protein